MDAGKQKKAVPKVVHFLIGLAIYLIFKFVIQAPEPMSDTGIEFVGIMLMAVYYWITIGTGWPSLFTILMVGFSGATKVTGAISLSFGDWMFAFLFGCMLINHVLSETGLSRRIAIWFITRKFVKGRPYLIVAMFFAAMWVLGLGMTSSATMVLFCALATEIITTCGFDPKEDFSQFLYCCIAWITIAGNGMTAIGHGNFITGMSWVAEAFEVEISVGQSALIGCSIGIVWILLLLLIMAKVFKINCDKLVKLDIDAMRESVPRMSRQEAFVGICFLIVIFCWVAKDLLAPTPLAGLGKSINSLGTAFPILMCVCILSVVPIEGKPLMDFNKACKTLPWQACIMIGTVRMLGTVMAYEELGVSAWLQQIFGPMVSGLSAGVFVLVCIGTVLFVTNLVSNSIAMVLFKVAAPLMLMIPGINAPALGVVMIAAAHYAMWTPGATTTTSYVAGAYVDGSFMVKHGWLPMLAAFVSLVCVGYGVACLVF